MQQSKAGICCCNSLFLENWSSLIFISDLRTWDADLSNIFCSRGHELIFVPSHLVSNKFQHLFPPHCHGSISSTIDVLMSETWELWPTVFFLSFFLLFIHVSVILILLYLLYKTIMDVLIYVQMLQAIFSVNFNVIKCTMSSFNPVMLSNDPTEFKYNNWTFSSDPPWPVALVPGSCAGNQWERGSGFGTNKHAWWCLVFGPDRGDSEEEALVRQPENRRLRG